MQSMEHGPMYNTVDDLLDLNLTCKGKSVPRISYT